MKYILATVVAALSLTIRADHIERLEDQVLRLFTVVQSSRQALKNKCVDGSPLKVAGKTYEKGVGVNGPVSGDFVPLCGGISFETKVGIDDASPMQSAAGFNIYADGRLAASSGPMKHGEPVKILKVDLEGVDVLTLEVAGTTGFEYQIFGMPSCFCDWIDAVFTMKDGHQLTLSTWEVSPQLGVLTPKSDGQPRVNGPSLFGVRPGNPLLYHVPVSGERPLEVTVEGLPAGTRYDAKRAMLLGTAPSVKGDYPLVIKAKNAKGVAEKKFRLVVGDKLALTPPMGWNSWNGFATGITDAICRRQAEAMVSNGLADHGWQYVVVDDGWERNATKGKADPVFAGPARDADGRVLTNTRFPDMKAMADYIHSLGLKAGLYSSPGPTTCGGYEGGWMHEITDARTYADWGYDYLKYDYCSYGTVYYGPRGDSELLPWLMMGSALRGTGRDIVYSLSVGTPDIAKVGGAVGANCWRISGDMYNTWMVVRRSVDVMRHVWYYTRPGEWCDPDMLVIRDKLHAAPRFTANEQYTHYSLWCLFSAPMMIGSDLTKLNDFTCGLYCNDEVNDVSQDELGLAAALVQTPEGGEVWAKPMSDGSIAAGVFNRNYRPGKVKMCFKKLGMRGKWRVRDLWRQRDEGVFENGYEPEILGHATQLVRLWPTEGASFEPGVTDIRDFAWKRYVEMNRPVDPDRAAKPAPCDDCPESRKAAR